MLAEPISQLLLHRELSAVQTLRASLGVDVLSDHHFWECFVARITSGSTTSHQSRWDIDLEGRRIEVKASSEFACAFGSGARSVFKFARPLGCGKYSKPADVLLLIGVDRNDFIHTWVIPASAVNKSTSITLTSPRVRKTQQGRGYDQFVCPPSQLLPEILRACHLRYDAKHHAETAYQTRRQGKAVDMFADTSTAEPRP